MAVFHKISIKDIKRETKEAVSVVLDIPNDLKSEFSYLSGQYITFKINVNGADVNRSYSLCSSPAKNETHTIAVKEVKGGKISTHLNRYAKAGDKIEAMPPMGNFILEPNASNANHYILFGGGSGITPLFSILKTVLEDEPNSKVTLLYANYNSDAVIFKNELEKINADESRVTLVHVFDQPKKSGGFLGFGKKAAEELTFVEGQINKEMALKLLKENTDLNFQNAIFYMCGPTGLMDSVGDALATLGINPEKINREYFTEKSEDDKIATDVGSGAPDAAFDGSAKVHVTYDGERTILSI